MPYDQTFLPIFRTKFLIKIKSREENIAKNDNKKLKILKEQNINQNTY